jgi:hypothetical protein
MYAIKLTLKFFKGILTPGFKYSCVKCEMNLCTYFYSVRK